MNTPYNKALVAAATPIIVWLAARYGLQLQPDEAAALVTLVTTLAVYVVPNRQQPAHNIQAYAEAQEDHIKAQEAYIQALEAKVQQAQHTGQAAVPTIHREEEN